MKKILTKEKLKKFEEEAKAEIKRQYQKKYREKHPEQKKKNRERIKKLNEECLKKYGITYSRMIYNKKNEECLKKYGISYPTYLYRKNRKRNLEFTKRYQKEREEAFESLPFQKKIELGRIACTKFMEKLNEENPEVNPEYLSWRKDKERIIKIKQSQEEWNKIHAEMRSKKGRNELAEEQGLFQDSTGKTFLSRRELRNAGRNL